MSLILNIAELDIQRREYLKDVSDRFEQTVVKFETESLEKIKNHYITYGKLNEYVDGDLWFHPDNLSVEMLNSIMIE